ncbi:hypothetical protein GCM10009104_08790 [Marinobacterium maritimum]|uniref:Uncharacterized protein n=1 Tax=Marinobacterium maritimum TaxID=500162 RepID=A0ABN1I3B2_9GAMM
MKKPNFPPYEHRSFFEKHCFEDLVSAIKEAAKEEKRHSGNTLSQCQNLVAKHAGFNNWSLLMKTLDSAGKFQWNPKKPYEDIFQKEALLRQRVREAVFKALPKGCIRFAEKDAYSIIAEDFSPSAFGGSSSGDDAVIRSLNCSLQNTYPRIALDHAIEYVLERGPWSEDEIYFDEFYSGCCD